MDLQRAANRAVFDGLAAYERRHGWRGHLQNVLAGDVTLANYQHPDWDSEPEVNSYVHALVVAVTPSFSDGQIWPLLRDAHARRCRLDPPQARRTS